MHPAKEGFSALPFFDEFDLSTVDILLISQYVDPPPPLRLHNSYAAAMLWFKWVRWMLGHDLYWTLPFFAASSEKPVPGHVYENCSSIYTSFIPVPGHCILVFASVARLAAMPTYPPAF